MEGKQVVDRRATILRWTRRALLGLFVTIAVLVVAGAVYQAVATEMDTRAIRCQGR